MPRMSKEAATKLLGDAWIEVADGHEPWVCHTVDDHVFGADSVHAYRNADALVDAVTYAEPWLHAEDAEPDSYGSMVDALEQARRVHGDEPTETLRTAFNEILKGTMQVVWWGKGAEYPHREMDEEEE